MGYPDLWEPLHKKVCNFVDPINGDWGEETIHLLLIPRRHLKSSIASIGLPPYIWTNRPDWKIGMSHAKRSMATTYCRELMGHMQTNSVIPYLAPHIFWEDPQNEAPLWTQGQFDVQLPKPDKVPSFSVSGPDAGTTGHHYHFILLDDLVDGENTNTRAARDKIADYIRRCIPQLRPGGKILIIGTRWNQDDAYGRLLKEEAEGSTRIRSLVLSCFDDAGDPIFPLWHGDATRAGFTRERLDQMREPAEMGEREFACQMLNQPLSDLMRRFKREDILRFDLGYDGMPPIPEGREKRCFVAVDPNRDTDPDKDRCAVVTGFIDSAGEIWIVDALVGHPTSQQRCSWIRGQVTRWNADRVFVEATGAQLYLEEQLKADMLRHDSPYHIEMVERGPRISKYDRIEKMSPLVEAHGLHIRTGIVFNELVEQLVNLRVDRHDDLADACSDIYNRGRRYKPQIEDLDDRFNPLAPQNWDSLDSPFRQDSITIGERPWHVGGI